MARMRINSSLIKDYKERSKPDITLWMVKELDIRKGTKVIKDDTISAHINKVKELIMLGNIVGAAWDGLDSNRIDFYTMNRLVRGLYTELVERKLIWISGLMSNTLKMLVNRVNNDIEREAKERLEEANESET